MSRHRVRKLPAARGMSAIMIAGGISAALGAVAVPALALTASAPAPQSAPVVATVGPEATNHAAATLFREHAIRGVRSHRERRLVRTVASRSVIRTPIDPQQFAEGLVANEGWGSAQWSCLDTLWSRESNWDPYAVNYGSGAYGIPQALPGWKMSSFGSDWRTNPVTQIRWGVQYIVESYGTPCAALNHSYNYGFY